MKRRQVLASIGATGLGSVTAIPGAASKSFQTKAGQKRRYVGVAFDPVSREITGNVRATISENDDGIRGQISFEQFTVPFEINSPNRAYNRQAMGHAVEGDGIVREYNTELNTHPDMRFSLITQSDGDVNGRVMNRSKSVHKGFTLRKVEPSKTESSLKSAIREEHPEPRARVVGGSDGVSTNDNADDGGGGGASVDCSGSCSSTDVCVGGVGGESSSTGDFNAVVHGYHNHCDYDVEYDEIEMDAGNRFHIQSFFSEKPPECDGAGTDYGCGPYSASYRIERIDNEIEFENWFPNNSTSDDTWGPSFSVGLGVPGTPFSLGVGSIRARGRSTSIEQQSRSYVDWYIDLESGWGELPMSQDESEGVRVDVVPMSTYPGLSKDIKFTASYEYRDDYSLGSRILSTEQVSWTSTVWTANP